jgi:hypothetical protein
MSMLILVAKVLAVWFVLSVVVGVWLGRFLSFGQRQVERQDDEDRG